MDLVELDFLPLNPTDIDGLVVGTSSAGTWSFLIYTVEFFTFFLGFMIFNGGYTMLKSFFYCTFDTANTIFTN